MVSTTVTKRSVGDSIGSVTLVKRRHPPAPSSSALSYSSSGMLWRPAVTTMKVKPRLAQTVARLTAGSAHVGSFSTPGLLNTWNGRMRVNTPIDGLKSTSHIKEATATEVATVVEKTVRNTPMPRIALLASTARPTPSTRPSGTVSRTNWTVTQREWRNSSDVATSVYCLKPTYTWLPPKKSFWWSPR